MARVVALRRKRADEKLTRSNAAGHRRRAGMRIYGFSQGIGYLLFLGAIV